MRIEFTIVAYLTLVLIILGIIISAILWSFSRLQNNANKFLAVGIFGSAWALIVAFLMETYLIFHVSGVYRTGHLAYLISIPVWYLYVREYVTNQKFSLIDICHFIPALFYLVDYFPVFILNTEEKRSLIWAHLSSIERRITYDEGWLTPWWFHYNSRYVLMVFYFFLQARIVFTSFNGKKWGNPVYHWLVYFITIQLFGFSPLLIREEELRWLSIVLAAALPVILTTLWLFFKPEILYGLTLQKDGVGISKGNSVGKRMVQRDGYKANLKHNDFPQLVHKHMADSSRYVQHGYSIQDLANDLAMHPHLVSQLLNQQMYISFNDLLNRYRIELCIDRLKKGDAQRITLEALAYECGFNNRNSFITSFKRFTGNTPSEYIRTVLNVNQN